MTKTLLHLLIAVAVLSLLACNGKEKAQAPAQPVVEARTVFNDYAIRNLDRTPQSTTEEIGLHRITIIDIWASWCGPCMHEMPNLVALHTEYADRGLGIIGISLDKDYNSWKQAIDENGMTWLQLSDLRGWDTAIVQDYAINAIPHTIVVDQQGTILQTGLRGEGLAAFVRQQLGAK